MVGRNRQHDRLRILPAGEHGGGRDGRPGIAARGLDHDPRLEPQLFRLAAGEETKIRGGEHDGCENSVRSATRSKAC